MSKNNSNQDKFTNKQGLNEDDVNTVSKKEDFSYQKNNRDISNQLASTDQKNQAQDPYYSRRLNYDYNSGNAGQTQEFKQPISTQAQSQIINTIPVSQQQQQFIQYPLYPTQYLPVQTIQQPIFQQPGIRQSFIPVATQQVVNQSVLQQPVLTQQVLTQPVLTQPVVTQPVVTQPVLTQPVMQSNICYLNGLQPKRLIENVRQIVPHDYVVQRVELDNIEHQIIHRNPNIHNCPPYTVNQPRFLDSPIQSRVFIPGQTDIQQSYIPPSPYRNQGMIVKNDNYYPNYFNGGFIDYDNDPVYNPYCFINKEK